MATRSTFEARWLVFAVAANALAAGCTSSARTLSPLVVSVSDVTLSDRTLQFHVRCTNEGPAPVYVACQQAERVLPMLDWHGRAMTLYYGPRKVDGSRNYFRPPTTAFQLVEGQGVVEWDQRISLPVLACKCSALPWGSHFRVSRFRVEVAYLSKWPYPEPEPRAGEAVHVHDADLRHKPTSSRSAPQRSPEALDVSAVQRCDCDW